MKRIRINIISVLGLLLMLLLCTNAMADIQSMKLLTAKIGWVATERELYWTTDTGSSWRNITPPSESFGNITAVFFLNTSQGWVLCCNNKGEYNEFNIAYTNDSGKTWSSQPIKLPNKDQINQKSKKLATPDRGYNQWDGTLVGTGWIDFIDPLQGSVILEIPANTRIGFTSGLLLQTTDGGKTWKSIGGCLPAAGKFHFTTSSDGWLSGYLDNHLFITHNGGNTWEEVTLEPPPQVLAAMGAQYDLPIFKNSQNGFLPIIYIKGSVYSITLVLFATHDGGKTWKADRVLPGLENIAGVYPSTVVDSVLITLVTSESERSLTLVKMLPDGKTVETKTQAFTIKGDMQSLSISKWWKLDYITNNQGWISTLDQLLSTTDGGANWTVITPQ